ncbi:phage portal protein [Lachnospiraceae bacterium MD335]|nr:phage portal protein [Lachnospiraceae bacterium MD335]
MAKEFRAEQVINGTFGEMWIDGEYLANVTALKAEVTLKKTAISMVQRLMEGQKMTGLEMKGEIKLHKINSFFIKKMNECFRRGKMMTCTIISNVKDPDALGGERIALYNCLFDKMTLADWEAGKMGEESYSFTFEDWEILDKI